MSNSVPRLSNYAQLVELQLPLSGGTGQKTVSTPGSRVALVAAETTLEAGVTMKPIPTNIGTVYIYLNATDSVGWPVANDGNPIFIEIDDLSKVKVDAANAGDGVVYIYS